MTFVDRATRCVVNWSVTTERDEETLQALVDGSPQPGIFFSDAFPTYASLDYFSAQHHMLFDKSQTYSVEADHAEFRHYLARLARRSRCFSRCIQALCEAITLFVFAWNARQLHKRQFPSYPAHVRDFLSFAL